MLAEVIPLHSSASDRGFTYRIPELLASSLRSGMLVTIPWRTTEDEGIVSTIVLDEPSDLDTSNIREISTVLTPNPVLSEAELRTAHAISARRFVPIHRTIGLFLSSPVIQRMKRADWSAPTPILHTPLPTQGNLLFCRDTESFILALAESIIPKTLLLFPDDGALFYWLQKAKIATDSIVVIPDKAYRTRRATLFREFREWKHSVVATVRKGIFLPLDGFDRIVAIEEWLGDRYEAFRHEYSFDEWTALLAHESGIPLNRISLSPTLVRLYEHVRTHRLVTR